MVSCERIPVVIGVTGHRNIDERDKDELKREVAAALSEIRSACSGGSGEGNTPVIMLNAFARGADMLCAEVAFGMGIAVYAVLPCSEEKYIKSFTDAEDAEKLRSYLAKSERVMVAPDLEKNAAWLGSEFKMGADDYEYRQAGIYIAEHCHVLLALWDGCPPEKQFGCGTVEVINFALGHKFLDGDHLFNPGILNDCAVLWLHARRSGGEKQPVRRRWLAGALAGEKGAEEFGNYFVCDDMPAYMAEIIAKTVRYNGESCAGAVGGGRLWDRPEELDDYRKNIGYHYSKADAVSFGGNQKYYNRLILLIAIIGTFVAFSFMLYDDASLTFMIFPCALAVAALIWIIVRGNKKGYHSKYIEYRAFSEAFRIQFYMSLCLREKQILANVCRLYSWTQKVDSAWIYKALQAVAAVSAAEVPEMETTKIIDVWIGNSKNPDGQLRYHTDKLVKNRNKAEKYAKISNCLTIITVAVYIVIFLMEAAGHILGAFGKEWFWNGELAGGISWRSSGIIVMGTVTAASLLFTGYFGKLSFGRKAEDNRKMSMFYASAYARWSEAKARPAEEIAKFVKEIAREEIVENGIWCSYVKDNSPEINL